MERSARPLAKGAVDRDMGGNPPGAIAIQRARKFANAGMRPKYAANCLLPVALR
jgi:hypothetical protein